jgi:PAS domain S-box-containing protein
MAFHTLNAIPTFDDHKVFSGFVGMTMDVTKETRTGLDLQAARSEIEVFFDVSLNLMCVADTEGRIVRMSRAWHDLLGIKGTDLKGRPFRDFIHPDDVERTMQVYAELLAGQKISGFVNRYQAADGSWREIEWQARMVKGFVYSAARDVTNDKAAERALASALQEERRTAEIQSQLVAVTSHEFRTPLASVRLAAESLERHWARMDESMRSSRIRTIMDTTDYLTSLVNDVLELGAATATNDPEEAIQVEVCGLLKDISRSLLASRSESPHRVKLELPESAILWKTRVRLLRRAYANLLENALKYSSSESTVLVRLEALDSGLVISVIDAGWGVPEGSEEFLFRSFFRAANVTGTPGTGLGLAIVAEAMKHLGGQVEYCRRVEGGSIFSIQLNREL